MIEPYQPPNAISGTLKPDTSTPPKPKNRKRHKKKNKNKKNSKWADQCMYAELLEMSEDNPWSDIDGLPDNLESAWVALGPVPAGKRCLAVTHQSSGIAGVVPNTTLRSRLLGKILIQRFPSNLPPLTILDCILDANWRDNGILHILDVVKWKGQNICDCEAPFRFWWRDTRLAELGPSSLVPAPYTKTRADHYQFPYPTKFMSIPYYTDTTLSTLYRHILPIVRTPRSFTIDIPNFPSSPFQPPNTHQRNQSDGMDVESPLFTFGSNQNESSVTMNSRVVTVSSDGLLLYVAEAIYESGTSPLSTWIPLVSYDDGDSKEPRARESDGPLDVFERLLCRRLQKQGGQVVEVEMG
ncbi:hypothetical protein AGABI2DRAFT_187358 [Agaricus bisporus var. bisporus H97]|uniref:hypothetical protein n=1 Tax=Agaricus bisporus var. bisporus (strain H97 / ATCC MYA-4626 / FGSC 10389) TaxID=936046 RepID=UPI00029F5234|nr:hypothetical protein AGABI2DRAFT_187358 [Agaricus bisporus var. bisporus H97]EKV44618.1 hypothetical protein AGABI2DRAFT_187358 [Agaricus bisporus var. bisporus H97]